MLQSNGVVCAPMKGLDVLLVAGTHGNEVNAPWLLDRWAQRPDLINTHGLKVQSVIGNPAAREAARRYIDRDLNRSFRDDLLASAEPGDHETDRARHLFALHGPDGGQPCRVAIDLHSTTAAMGSCLVLYGRRPADLALAALVQGALGLPIYLHEADAAQTGFLVERWSCGLVIEVGPVAQMVLNQQIVQQTHLALECCLASLAMARKSRGQYPSKLVVHRHLGSCDLPRDEDGEPIALVHPQLERQHWKPLPENAPLFKTASGEDHPQRLDTGASVVFVNEAAYAEKSIAFSVSTREVWPVQSAWRIALEQLMAI